MNGTPSSNLANLKKLRKAAGFNQKDAARALGVPLFTYRNWEQGLNAPRSVEDLLAIADLFGCTVDALLRGGASSANPLRTAGTHALVAELIRRGGVRYAEADPSTDISVPVRGPATVLVVSDAATDGEPEGKEE